MEFKTKDKKLFGVVVPIASIKTKNSWCVGEFADLIPFANFCKKINASVIQILPVNDSGSQSSPYSALSAFALHPMYIRVSDLPEAKVMNDVISSLDDFAKSSKAYSKEDPKRFSYYECYNMKMKTLRQVFDKAFKDIASNKELEKYINNNPWVKSYSVFRRLKADNNEASWRDWKEYQNPSKEDIEKLWNDSSYQKDQLFYAWIQFRASEQFKAVANYLSENEIVLLGDIPILMNDDSCDVWSRREVFNDKKHAGAPPDMYSASGQNWGFPVYDWDAMAKDDYSFWKERVSSVDAYFSAYRIDHVLGFFRIWTLGSREQSGYLGRFLPTIGFSLDELMSKGFSNDRIRWLSEPHIRGDRVRDAVASSSFTSSESKISSEELLKEICSKILVQIPGEDLFRFSPSIHGELDFLDILLQTCGNNKQLCDSLYMHFQNFWHDRTFLLDDGSYYPGWTYYDSTSWNSLSDEERNNLQYSINEKAYQSEQMWRQKGKALLGMLKSASKMLPCAEDLGAVPSCVPEVLGELGIPGLRVPRWNRFWDRPNKPFVNPNDYTHLSICVPGVHDSSSFREWWENEEGKEEFVKAFSPETEVVQKLDVETETKLLESMAKANSLIYIVQIQDLIDLSGKKRSSNPSFDRVNIPGTTNDWNWTWKMNVAIEDLESEKATMKRIMKVGAR